MEESKEITVDLIKEQVLEWVNTNLRRFSFRDHQLEYIVDIIYSVLSDNHVNLVEAPTGTGKSIMVIIMAGVLNEYYKKSSYILCSDLYLWEQYSKALEKYHLKNFGKIKGMAGNYICDETGEEMSAAPCRLSMIPFSSLVNKDWCLKHNWLCGLTCKYMRERQRAIISEITLMPYQLWFEHMRLAGCLDDGSSGASDCPFGKRDIVFCDECHKIPQLCQDAQAIEINKHVLLDEVNQVLMYCKEINLILPTAETIDDLDIPKYLEKIKDNIDHLLELPKDQQMDIFNALMDFWFTLNEYAMACYQGLRDLFEESAKDYSGEKAHLSKTEYKIYNMAKKISSLTGAISGYIQMVNLSCEEFAKDELHPHPKPGVKYIVKTDNRTRDPQTGKMEWPDNPIVTYKFAKEDLLVYKTMLCPSPYKVMLSATVGGHRAFDDNIGIKYTADKKSTMFVIPSTFDFTQSPIYFIPGRKMSKEFINNSFPQNAAIINKILKSDKHANEKGIIHTGSYKNAWDLKEMLDPEVQKRVFIYSTSKEKKDILEKYAQSKNGVLIGPTLTEGIDLPEDGCRFIIIFKVPYPYLGDELVKAKISLFPKWYNSETTNSIIQGVGRGNRTPTDWCTTYILDGSFAKLYEDTREQYSNEFKERIKLLNG